MANAIRLPNRRTGFVEVALRDGLQNESVVVSTTDKVRLVERAIAAGARRIEVSSFVHPARVPQMADAEAVAALPKRDDIVYIALVLNKRGALRALDTDIDELGAVCVASDTFANAHQGQTSPRSLAMAKDVVRLADTIGAAVPLQVGELVARVVAAIAPIPVRVHFHNTRNTGLDLQRLIETSHWLGGVMGRQLPATVSRARAFPTAA